VGVNNNHALACVAVLHGDRHGITVVANFLAGKVGYENRLSRHCPLLWDQWFLLTKQTIILLRRVRATVVPAGAVAALSTRDLG
jgi:hypothetical protein